MWRCERSRGAAAARAAPLACALSRALPAYILPPAAAAAAAAAAAL